VWNAANHSDADQAQFIDFMRVSGMCFTVSKAGDGDEARYIAPDLLPDSSIRAAQREIAVFAERRWMAR
jgi:hypothetical protein